MKNKIFLAALLLAAAAFLFTACTQSGNSSNSGSGNSGEEITLNNVWKITVFKKGGTDLLQSKKLYVYFGDDGFRYFAEFKQDDNKLHKLGPKIQYTVSGNTITFIIVDEDNQVTTFKIEGNTLTIGKDGDDFYLVGTKSSDYTADQITNAE